MTEIDIAVLGAGAAGLTAAYSLKALGLVPFTDFVVLDAEEGPGGTWRRGWDFARIGLSADVVELPGMAELGLRYRDLDPETPTTLAVPRFHAHYEDAYDLFVLRPARVVSVSSIPRSTRLRVTARNRLRGTTEFRPRVVVNATGHWGSPFVPWVPGRDNFRGVVEHVAHLQSLEQFRDQRVLVVGGGRSALAVLAEREAEAAGTLWSTRRPPDFLELPRIGIAGRRSSRLVDDADAHLTDTRERGVALPSDVTRSGIPLTRAVARAVRSGYLASRGPVARFHEHEVEFADGSREAVDVVLWATGSRDCLRHLAPLHLRAGRGALRLRDGWSRADARIAFVGYGPGRRVSRALEDAVRLSEQVIDRVEQAAAAENFARRRPSWA